MPHDENEIFGLEARRREEGRAVEEAGGGVSEGFELAEDDLVEHASHGDELSAFRVIRDAGTLDEEVSDAVYGEADGELLPGLRGEPAKRPSATTRDCGGVMPPVSRGFHRRRAAEGDASRIPPGQYLTRDFPVLSAGPTPRTPLEEWSLTIDGAVDEPRRWSWEEFHALPSETVTVDIHCVTKWSKLDTRWTGVPVDALLAGMDGSGAFVTAWCDGGYTTNVPLGDLVGGRAWVAYEYGGVPLEPEHGGPARLLVPHLYFWKSAKWLRGLTLTVDDEPGFWETYGYHNYGDPWREQRYWGD